MLVFLLQVYLVFTKSINWDEYFHFQHIQELRDGTLNRSFQVLYIRYFAWLFNLEMDAIDRLLVGRLVILSVTPVTIAAIYGLARQFTQTVPALLCALAYLTGGDVFLHSFAFRADPQATALLMSALYLLSVLRPSLLYSLIIAALVATACMITIKSVFYAPAFLGILYWRTEKEGSFPYRFSVIAAYMVALSATLFTILFFLHGLSLDEPPLAKGGAELASASSTVFSQGFLPQAHYVIRQMLLAPLLVMLVIVSPWLWRHRRRAEKLAFAGLLFPLMTILFYRNSYPYYYVFVMAPAAVAICPAVELLISRIGARLCMMILTGQAVLLTVREPVDVLPTQRDLDHIVREIFPNPVPYIDFCGMIADYPRVFPFLTSGWGLERYRLAGRPLLPARMEGEGVPLLIANDLVIEETLRRPSRAELFLPEDARLMRENFVQHWGPVWVAGKHIAPGQGQMASEFATAGVYTVEGAAISVDGRPLRPGDTVWLDRGLHRILPNPTRGATLRWGNHLPRPAEPSPPPRLFTVY